MNKILDVKKMIIAAGITVILIILLVPNMKAMAAQDIDAWDAVYTFADDGLYISKNLLHNRLRAYSPKFYALEKGTGAVIDYFGFDIDGDQDLSDWGKTMVRASATDYLIDKLSPDNKITKAEEYFDVALKIRKTNGDNYSTPDGDLRRFIDIVDAYGSLAGDSTDFMEKGSRAAEYLGIGNVLGLKFAAWCDKLCADLGNFILDTKEYKDFVAQYSDKRSFNKAFWKASMTGIWEGLKDIPNELFGYHPTIAFKEYDVIDTPTGRVSVQRRTQVVPTHVFLRFNPDAYKIQYGVADDYNLKVKWGYDINDFDVFFDTE